MIEYKPHEDEVPPQAKDYKSMLNSDIPYEERELIQRVIRSLKPQTGERDLPRWTLVKRAFCTGQTVSKLICYRYGFDPDKEISAPYLSDEDEDTYDILEKVKELESLLSAVEERIKQAYNNRSRGRVRDRASDNRWMHRQIEERRRLENELAVAKGETCTIL